mmetsp:Transcript_23987/g.75699  ORF Transcript_23987/g.75699 Transcript_23987/m.75699 type:complete len:213 (-) Transcript_23987:7-645(-)
MSSKPFCNSTSAYWIKPMSCRKATTGLFSWSPGAWRWSSCSFRRSSATWTGFRSSLRMSESSMCISLSMLPKPLRSSRSAYSERPQARRKGNTSDFPPVAASGFPSVAACPQSAPFRASLTTRLRAGERRKRRMGLSTRATWPSGTSIGGGGEAATVRRELPCASLLSTCGEPTTSASLPDPFGAGAPAARPGGLGGPMRLLDMAPGLGLRT